MWLSNEKSLIKFFTLTAMLFPFNHFNSCYLLLESILHQAQVTTVVKLRLFPRIVMRDVGPSVFDFTWWCWQQGQLGLRNFLIQFPQCSKWTWNKNRCVSGVTDLKWWFSRRALSTNSQWILMILDPNER